MKPATEATYRIIGCVTFGQRYRTEVHPSNDIVGFVIHPDGYVFVSAPSEPILFGTVSTYFGMNYSNLYRKERDVEENFPRGRLAEIIVSEDTTKIVVLNASRCATRRYEIISNYAKSAPTKKKAKEEEPQGEPGRRFKFQ